jgi:hypothetical protein
MSNAATLAVRHTRSASGKGIQLMAFTPYETIGNRPLWIDGPFSSSSARNAPES